MTRPIYCIYLAAPSYNSPHESGTIPFSKIYKWFTTGIKQNWVIPLCWRYFILYQDKDVEKIKKVLNKEFSLLCEWFIDNMLPIHFGDDKKNKRQNWTFHTENTL